MIEAREVYLSVGSVRGKVGSRQGATVMQAGSVGASCLSQRRRGMAAGWRVAGGFQVVGVFVAAIYFTQRRKDAKRWVAAE